MKLSLTNIRDTINTSTYKQMQGDHINMSQILIAYLCNSAWVSIWTATACHAWATEPVASLDAFNNLAESLDSPFAYWASNSDLET